MFDLTGKKAIITGASRGMGNAIARAFINQGAEVVITGTKQNVVDVATELAYESRQPVHGVVADFSTREGVENCFSKCIGKLQQDVDILVNNAGIQINHLAENFPLDDWDKIMRVNLDAVFLMSQFAGRIMLKKGRGRVINIASLLSIFGGRQCTAYAAAKGGVTQITKAMSNEWASNGITVNAIAPGYMNTDMNKAFCSNLEKSGHLLARIPVGRWGKEEDIASSAVYLAADESSYVTGTMIVVDGGFSVW